MAERSKARVCGRSLAGVAGLNPDWGMDVCVVCCKYRQKANAGQSRHIQVRMKYRGQESREKDPGRRKRFFFLQNVHTDLCCLPSLLFIEYRVFFWDKAAGV